MPEDTPNRGYTYPTYTDPTNFPAQLQELATDIDTDVQTIIDQVEAARDEAPSATITNIDDHVVNSGVIEIPEFGQTVYDNASMVQPSLTELMIPVEGLYMLSSWMMFLDDTAVYDVSFGIRLSGSTRANQMYRTNDGATGIRVSLTTLTYCFPGDLVATVLIANDDATLGTRYLSATRITGEGFLP